MLMTMLMTMLMAHQTWGGLLAFCAANGEMMDHRVWSQQYRPRVRVASKPVAQRGMRHGAGTAHRAGMVAPG